MIASGNNCELQETQSSMGTNSKCSLPGDHGPASHIDILRTDGDANRKSEPVRHDCPVCPYEHCIRFLLDGWDENARQKVRAARRCKTQESR